MDLYSIESMIKTQLEARIPRMLNANLVTSDGKYIVTSDGDYIKFKNNQSIENNDYNITFTTELDDTIPIFPNVYIHELEPTEIGNSLENKKIHAIRDTIQIIVTTNTYKADCKKVANACISVMKELSFLILSFPIYTKQNNLHRYVFRAQRVIASGDMFY